MKNFEAVVQDRDSRKMFHFFEAVSEIPRCSGNERAIAEYLRDFALHSGLDVVLDETSNVVIKKPGSKGREGEPPIILQGHSDMVCEKTEDSSHDFGRDPLKLAHDGKRIFSESTTLGADNGIALAMILALLDDPEASHPPIEAVLTAGEEEGMDGALALDFSLLVGRRMINLDSEDEGEFTVGCAGGATVDAALEIELMDLPAPYKVFELKVEGFLGGHSGVEIEKERGNANIVTGRALLALLPWGVRILDVNGGTRDNVIPSSGSALIAVPAGKEAMTLEFAEKFQAALLREYRGSDPGVVISMNENEAYDEAPLFSEEGAEKLVHLLLTLPTGVLHMSTDIEGLVDTSASLAIVRTDIKDGKAEVTVTVSARSSLASRLDFVVERIKAAAAGVGAKTLVRNSYPGWEYAKDSPLRDKATELWHEMFGGEAKVTATHGGLECGLFTDRLPGLDVISFGPNIRDAHTTVESMEIESAVRVYAYLKGLLKRI